MPVDFPWFDFEVPRHLVAQEPLRHRADARLMVVDRHRQEIEHHHVRDLPQFLRGGDRLVLNDTKVIAARLVGRRAQTGGRWQGLFLESTEEGHWRILCKTRGRLAPGEAIGLVDRDGRAGVKLWLLEQLPEGEWLAHVDSELPTDLLLERIGRVPLPPYIRGGNMIDSDVANYQTVFARNPGAVAAPTAGLHFTKELFRSLHEQGVSASTVTLHVGLGTFKPVETARLDEHPMHSEFGEISAAAAAEMNATRGSGGRLVAVGTTVVRLLETAVRSDAVDRPARGEISQAVSESSRQGKLESQLSSPIIPWRGKTELFIRPPFEFRAVDSLLTNFHFPRTTLLVLVQTFAGRELIAAAYEQAIREEYRFFSYGDAMIII